ncbi:MAG: tetratricopeptide repeat protein [Aureliella sp.]
MKNLLTAILLASISFGATPSFAADKVYPKNGVPASGQIKALSWTKATINVRGKDQTFDMADVSKVAFDGEPRELERARDQFVNGQYDQALEEIKKVDKGGISRKLITQDIDFYRWYCEGKMALSGNGDRNAAINGLRSIASANRTTHHLLDIAEMLGQLHMSIGKPKEAATFFGVLLRAPDDTTKAIGTYRLGLVELADDKTAEARKRLSSLASAASSSPEMKRLQNLARVALSVCDQRDGKTEEALKRLDTLVAATDSTDQELYARINNAKGACYLAQNKPTEALFHYLQTDLLFFSEAEAHAEALYHLSDLWKRYGNPSKAADARQRLSNQYASSAWASKSN